MSFITTSQSPDMMQKRELELRNIQEATSGAEKRRKVEHNPLETTASANALQRKFVHDDYTVGWICAISTEYVAARAFLDEKHESPEYVSPHDNNTYTLGRIGKHNVVIAVLPDGEYGTDTAAGVARDMLHTFPNVRIGLLVGIGGGAPSPKHDIRLGDIIVSSPRDNKGGVFQYDYGKTIQHQSFQHTRFLDQPPVFLRTAVNGLKAQYDEEGHRLEEAINKVLEKNQRLRQRYKRPDPGSDRLYKSGIIHPVESEASCTAVCGDDPSNLIYRRDRTEAEDNPAIYYGLIASANQLMKDATVRDALANEKDVLCFEMEAAGLMNHFPCLVIRGICDYSDSHKNNEWQGYAAMAAAAYAKDLLCQILPTKVEAENRISDVENEVRQRKLDREKKVKNLLKMLYTCPYRDRKERNDERVPGTCEWFTDHPLFQNWNKNQKSSLLWVSADPGCGKSVLAKYLVDHVLLCTSTRTTCYFFFKDDFTDQKSATNAICAILRQLFLAKPHLLSDSILDKFDLDGDKYTQSFHDLWSTLSSVAADQTAGEIVCILDALDECQDSGRSQLIQAVRNLYASDPSNCSLKLLLTSRPYDHIRREFQELEDHLPTIHLSGEDEVEVEKISREIDLVIKNRVEAIGRKRFLELDERAFLQEQLMLVPNRTYLWVNLTLDVIEKTSGFTKGNIRKVMSRIPQSVDDAYNRILDRSSDTEKARKLLHIVTAATRPLSLEEMSLIMAIEETHRSYDDIMQELEPRNRFRATLRDLCGLFVVIIDSKIYLLHQTAKEFLVRDNSSSLKDPSRLNSQHNPLKWKHSLQPGESNRILAERCIWYLTLDFVETRLATLLDYSAHNWPAHFREAGIRSEETIAALARNLCEVKSKRYNTWSFRYAANTSRFPLLPASSLTIASYFGLYAVAKLMIDKGADIESKDEYKRTPLSWAAEHGHEALVKLLIDKGADIETKGKDNRTPLSWAADYGQEAVVKLLIDKGADIESKDEYGCTPLSLAAEHGSEAVVKLLINKGADIETKDKNDWTPLLRAGFSGEEAVVKLLIDKGANIESKDKNGRTLLSWAAQRGRKAVVKLLIDKGVDIESKDQNDHTPLSWAGISGEEAVVKLLIDTGADIESKNKYGCTPLSWAVQLGQEAVVKLLIDKGADIESKDRGSRTPLSWAAQRGHEAVVKLLIDRGADIDSKDKDDQTPLSWAAKYGHEAVVELLDWILLRSSKIIEGKL